MFLHTHIYSQRYIYIHHLYGIQFYSSPIEVAFQVTISSDTPSKTNWGVLHQYLILLHQGDRGGDGVIRHYVEINLSLCISMARKERDRGNISRKHSSVSMVQPPIPSRFTENITEWFWLIILCALRRLCEENLLQTLWLNFTSYPCSIFFGKTSQFKFLNFCVNDNRTMVNVQLGGELIKTVPS